MLLWSVVPARSASPEPAAPPSEQASAETGKAGETPDRPAPERQNAPAAEAAAAEQPPVMVVFDFTSPPDPALGKKLADALRLRAARLGKLTLVDALSTAGALAEGESPALVSPPEAVARLLKDRFGAQLGLWGRVARAADGSYTIEAAGLDLRPGAARPMLRKTCTAEKPQLVNARCDEILAELTGLEKTSRPKEADPETAARARVRRKNLVANGNFEAPGDQPRGWEKVNGLTMFLRDEGGARGRVLHIDTDVYEREHNRWIQKFKAGAPLAEAPKKTPTTGPKYDTVGGNYGVHNYCDPIPVTPGKTYRLQIDYRCKTGDLFFPKLFFRGWADVAGDDRIVTDGYLSLRSMEKTGEWKHNCRLFTVPRPEEIGGRRVKYVRLMIYAYWPPGDYYFDNVGFFEVVSDAGGAPVLEPAPTPGR